VGSGLADENKLIGLVTGFDRYRPGEVVVLRFIRMTAFPIAVAPEFILEKNDDRNGVPQKVASVQPDFMVDFSGEGPRFDTIGEMMNIRYRLPADLPPGHYTLRARFNEKEWTAMPKAVATPFFEIVK